MNELSLFSGYCGITLGLKLYGTEVRTIGYCEIDPFCQKIIKARIRDRRLDDAPIWADIRTADFQGLQGLVDIITGGFPCQDISYANSKGRGLSGERSGLWFDYFRVIGELRPRYALLENVSAILTRGISTVLGGLAEAGYDARWAIVTAAECGAPHLRKRWFCLAYPSELGCHPCDFRLQQPEERKEDDGGDPPDERRSNNQVDLQEPAEHTDPKDERWEREQKPEWLVEPRGQSRGWNQWDVAPSRLQHLADRTPEGLAQLRAAGNGVVPAMVARFLRQVLV